MCICHLTREIGVTFGPRWLSRKEKTGRRVDLRYVKETLCITQSSRSKYYRALERGKRKRRRRTRRSAEWATVLYFLGGEGEELYLMGRR